MNKTITIKDECSKCGKVIETTLPQDWIVGSIIKCPHCDNVYRVDCNLNLESVNTSSFRCENES